MGHKCDKAKIQMISVSLHSKGCHPSYLYEDIGHLSSFKQDIFKTSKDQSEASISIFSFMASKCGQMRRSEEELKSQER